jgi:hypothetical protein
VAEVRSAPHKRSASRGALEEPQGPQLILIDVGPLVVLVDADDQHHSACTGALKAVREPLATVWPPLTEAMYLLADLPRGQDAIWEMMERGAINPCRYNPQTFPGYAS